MVSFPQVFPPQSCIRLSSPPYVLHNDCSTTQQKWFTKKAEVMILSKINVKRKSYLWKHRLDYSLLYALVCSSPLCFSSALGSIVGFSQYTANFIYVYIYCMSRGRHVSASLILGHLQFHRSLCSLQCQV